MDAGEEIGVVRAMDRHEKLRLLHRQQVARKAFVSFFLGESPGEVRAKLPPRRPPHRGDAVQRRAGLDVERGEVEDLVADGHAAARRFLRALLLDRKSTRLNSIHSQISYAVVC